MGTFFVNWNPRLHSWVCDPTFADTVWRTRRGREVHITWTVRDSSRIEVMDTAFFTLCDAGQPVGILGQGVVSGDPEQDESWDPNRAGVDNYVPLVMQAMVPVEHVLRITDVAPRLPGGVWPEAASGECLPTDVAEALRGVWDEHWRSVLHRSCAFCGGTAIDIEAVPPLTDSAHRCRTCNYLWGEFPTEPIVSGPDDLPAVLECCPRDMEVTIAAWRDDPTLKVLRNDTEALVLSTAEGEVMLAYPFHGEPFVDLVREDWRSWSELNADEDE